MEDDKRMHLSGRIQLIQGDITTLKVDAIVNAANASQGEAAQRPPSGST
jgi:hypothetical protein